MTAPAAEVVGSTISERPRLLLVEDDQAIRIAVTRALPDVDVVQAENAEAALDLMTVAPAQLVITDIALPQMDGCALAARLREHWPAVPVMAISGYVEGRDVEEFHFDTFLEKPIDLSRLRVAVAALLQRSS